MSATGKQTQAGAAASNADTKKKAPSIPKGKREVKILMLHGYTQSGGLFSSKTKALSKLLVKALSPLNLHPTLIYPTAPHRLRPSDIPGYQPPADASAATSGDDASDHWAWFRKDEATGRYAGFEEGMRALARCIEGSGPVDGVLGFSQGGAVAALVAAALEVPHRSPPSLPPNPNPSSSPNPPSTTPSPSSPAADPSWPALLRAANARRPLRFCVVYSGFYAPAPELQWLYAPPLSTPTLHYLGGLDTVVEESRSRALVERCVEPTVLVHPGGHYVPVAKDWVVPLVGWLRQRFVEGEGEAKGEAKDEESL
ncbi:hypothetical protein F4810DRAFT_677043 [Camillea tinctor]|nr:hypothetical protein F4810DRAFT_677043 [Camillea tinctor]